MNGKAERYKIVDLGFEMFDVGQLIDGIKFKGL
jgi:hypothetical protein